MSTLALARLRSLCICPALPIVDCWTCSPLGAVSMGAYIRIAVLHFPLAKILRGGPSRKTMLASAIFFDVPNTMCVAVRVARLLRVSRFALWRVLPCSALPLYISLLHSHLCIHVCKYFPLQSKSHASFHSKKSVD